MKEYLDPDNGYALITADDDIKGSSDWVEVPEGADKYIYFGEFDRSNFYKGDCDEVWQDEGYWDSDMNDYKRYCKEFGTVLWQRSETEYLMQGKNGERLMESVGQAQGMKFDSNKPRFSLLPKGAVNSIIDVLEFGAKKYDVDNWQQVSNSKERYYNAAMRHIDLWWNGEKLDKETGLHHLAHAATNLIFLKWFDDNGNP